MDLLASTLLARSDLHTVGLLVPTCLVGEAKEGREVGNKFTGRHLACKWPTSSAGEIEEEREAGDRIVSG